MSDDNWQVGDLALCLNEDEFCPVRLTPMDVRRGAIYSVQRVGVLKDDFGRDCLVLGLVGFPWSRGWNAVLFRKIRPHTPDEEDAETIRLMRLKRAPVEA